EVERVTASARDVAVAGDVEGAAGRRLSGDSAGKTQVGDIVELKRIDAAGKGDGLGVRARELQRGAVIDDQRPDTGQATREVERARLDFDGAKRIVDGGRDRVEAQNAVEMARIVQVSVIDRDRRQIKLRRVIDQNGSTQIRDRQAGQLERAAIDCLESLG